MLWSSAASMPSNQIFFSVMFVGKCSLQAKRPRSSACTSHVLQYSSNLSYEHSRSLQSFLCSGAVIVLICWTLLHVFLPQQSWCKHRFACMACRKRSFFVEALLNLHNFEKRRQKYTLFYNLPNFSALFAHSEDLTSISIQNYLTIDSNRFIAISEFLNRMRLSSNEW